MRSDDALLLDMLIAARKILRFVAGMSESGFAADDMAQSAVIRELQVIGEAARLVREETRSVQTQVDWRAMIGMRNRLIHEYFAIRLDVVWQTVQEDIPPLLHALERAVPPEEEFEDQAHGDE
jgi:uncharacterized protein with HEPN domain